MCLGAAWRRAGEGRRDLRSNLVWAVCGASLLNGAMAMLWIGSEALMGPAVLIFAVGLPYLVGLLIAWDLRDKR